MFPLALCMDATAFAKRDSLVVFTVHFLATGRRYLALPVRKSQLFDCGCGGWDSLYPLYACLHWSLAVLPQSTVPEARHDQTLWRSRRYKASRWDSEPWSLKTRVVTGLRLLCDGFSNVVFVIVSLLSMQCDVGTDPMLRTPRLPLDTSDDYRLCAGVRPFGNMGRVAKRSRASRSA